MFFLLLYQYALSIFNIKEQIEAINNKLINKENASNIDQRNNLSQTFFFRVNETSYFRPLKINLSKIYENHISICSLQGTQYVSLSGIQTLVNKTITFESIFANIESVKLEVYNLSLIESPIFCTHGPIILYANYLTSDFFSISANYISTVNISQQFNILENNINDEISKEPHAKIILQENARYSLLKSINSTSATPNPVKNEINNSDFFSDGKLLENEEDNITSIYVLNSTLEKLNIYNRYVVAVFSNSTLNLTCNASNEIQINTSSSTIYINLLESPSYRNHILLNLYLTEVCRLSFDPSFDLVTNNFILEDIRIYHSKELTAFSLTSVPYVTFLPIETVIFIPERHNSENYCLCLKSRFEECVENNECLLYHVNKSNYFYGTNSSFLSAIARSKTNIINIYVTQTKFNTNDYHIIALRQSTVPGKIYNFISTDPDIQTILAVQDSSLDQSTPIELSFTDISRVELGARTGIVTTLRLKNSPINIERSFSVANLETDLSSLATQQTETITITSLLTLLPHTTLSVTGVDLLLAQNSQMNIKEISYFPYVTFSTDFVGFSDGNNDFNVRVQNAGPATIVIQDSTFDLDKVIDIRSANSNVQLQLSVIFNLTNPLVVSFLNSFPLPENVEFSFIPSENEISTLFLIMPFDNEEGPGHYYNFGNITGNLSLILLTPETIYTFIIASARGDFIINNIPNLALNVMDVVDSVTLFEDSVNISSIYGIQLHLEKNLVYKQLTLLINTTRNFVLSLGAENMKSIFPLVIESTVSNTTIFFDETFGQLYSNSMNKKEESLANLDLVYANEILKSVVVNHHTFNVTLMTNLEAVPMVVVDDDVNGVLYVANRSYFEIPNNNYISYRSGPELLVNVTDDMVTVNQNDFLAEKVTFCGKPFNFLAHSKSRVNYTFVETQPKIDISQSDNISWFEVFALNLEKSQVIGVSNIYVDYLQSDIFSLSMNSTQNLVVGKSSSIRDDALNGIQISKDKIKLTSNLQEGNDATIRGNHWRIYYGGSEKVVVSIDEKSLSQEIELFLTGKLAKTVYFEKSWYKVRNADKFVIIIEDKSAPVTVQADLMNMPEVVVVDSDGQPAQFTQVLYKAVYTNWLSFVIFIALAFIIVVISTVLMIVGFCRYRKKMTNFDAKQTNKTMLEIPETSGSNESEFIS